MKDYCRCLHQTFPGRVLVKYGHLRRGHPPPSKHVLQPHSLPQLIHSSREWKCYGILRAHLRHGHPLPSKHVLQPHSLPQSTRSSRV